MPRVARVAREEEAEGEGRAEAVPMMERERRMAEKSMMIVWGGWFGGVWSGWMCLEWSDVFIGDCVVDESVDG